MTTTISVILNLIQNQLDPDFRHDDSYGDDSVRQLADKEFVGVDTWVDPINGLK